MKKTMGRWLPLLGLALMAGACAQNKNLTAESLDGEWNIVQVDGFKATPEAYEEEPYLGFNLQERRLYGTNGCNLLMGGLNTDSLSAGRLSFGAVASTRRACAHDELERRMTGAFSRVKGARLKGNRLELTDAAGHTVFLLSRRAARSSEQ